MRLLRRLGSCRGAGLPAVAGRAPEAASAPSFVLGGQAGTAGETAPDARTGAAGDAAAPPAAGSVLDSQAARPPGVPLPAAVGPSGPPGWQLLLGVAGALAVLAAGIHNRRRA
jgi:hypothetical protein